MVTQSIAQPLRMRPEVAVLPPQLRSALLKRATRVKFAGAASFWQAPDVHGDAVVCNLGHGQLMLRLNRFLEAGKTVYIQMNCLTYRGVAFDVTAEVLWCRETLERDSLVAVVQLVKDSPEECPDDYIDFVESSTESES